jgi:hypothetical protein
MAKQIYLLFLIILLLLPMVNAQVSSLGVFKQGECVQLLQTCADCTYNTVTSVTNPDSTQALGLTAMEKSGLVYNLTFCDTNQSGTYTVNGFGDLGGTNTIWNYQFDITPNGNISTVSDSITMVWQIVVLIIALICFMTMGIIFKIDAVKIFFFVLAGLTLFLMVGLGLSSAQNYLYDYTQYQSVYSAFYVILAIVGGTALIGLVIWLIYFVFQKFSKTKIGNFDED